MLTYSPKLRTANCTSIHRKPSCSSPIPVHQKPWHPGLGSGKQLGTLDPVGPVQLQPPTQNPWTFLDWAVRSPKLPCNPKSALQTPPFFLKGSLWASTLGIWRMQHLNSITPRFRACCLGLGFRVWGLGLRDPRGLTGRILLRNP